MRCASSSETIAFHRGSDERLQPSVHGRSRSSSCTESDTLYDLYPRQGSCQKLKARGRVEPSEMPGTDAANCAVRLQPPSSAGSQFSRQPANLNRSAQLEARYI